MSKSNDVYDYIIGRLTSAGYGFGESLLVKELSQETGASRQPIMSALNRLRTEGFVKIIPQVGCEIINPSKDEIADFFLLFQLQEGLLAQLAAKRRTEEELLELNLIQQRIMSLREDDNIHASYQKLNQAFHRCLHLMAHSPLLDRKQRNNFNMCDFFITHTIGFKTLKIDVAKDHEGIIAAIEKKSASKAKKEAEIHIRDIGEAVIESL